MPDIDEETRELARRHYAVEVGVKDIFVLRDTGDATALPGGSPCAGSIKLLEVNENTVPAGIAPIKFGPAPASGIHFSTVIVEVTPEEFQRIQTRELRLPAGWEIGDRIAPPELPSK